MKGFTVKEHSMAKKHTKHLCALVGCGDTFDEVRKAVMDARFICAKCGRVARKKKRLCSPRKL